MLNILDQWAAIGLLACGRDARASSPASSTSRSARSSRAPASSPCKVANSTSPTLGHRSPGVATGLGLGIVNGIVIDRTRINSFIATLATSIVYGGLAILITGGLPRHGHRPELRRRSARRSLFGITYPVWVVDRLRGARRASCCRARSSGATSTRSAATPRRRGSRACGSTWFAAPASRSRGSPPASPASLARLADAVGAGEPRCGDGADRDRRRRHRRHEHPRRRGRDLAQRCSARCCSR